MTFWIGFACGVGAVVLLFVVVWLWMLTHDGYRWW